MTAHVPGPWALDEDDLSITADVGAHICRVTDVEDLPCVDPDDEDEVQEACLANGRLIAAAPDLLAALAEYVVLGAGKCTIGKATAEKARVAIAKAEGREP